MNIERKIEPMEVFRQVPNTNNVNVIVKSNSKPLKVTKEMLVSLPNKPEKT
jgi:hypothetical protein